MAELSRSAGVNPAPGTNSRTDERPLHVRVAEALGDREPEYGHEWDEAAHGRKGCTNCGITARWDDAPQEPCFKHYDTDWSATGPLIQLLRGDGWLVGVQSDNGGEWLAWKDDIGQNTPRESYRGSGPTPLIAVCNLILALKEAGKL